MAFWRTMNFVALLLTPAVSFGQAHDLTEAPRAGECFKVTIETTVTGAIKPAADKEKTIALSAKNEHAILERVLTADKGVVRKAARYYEKALSEAEIAGEKVRRVLRDERRLVVAQRIDDQPLCYSPAGPLMQPEIELITEHFDTLHLTGLLPGKENAIDDKWTIGNASVQALCLFEGLISQDLTGKLTEVKDGLAVIAVEGTASGVELGAAVKLDIKATVRFDLLNHRLVALEWKQKDTREQGPASPASDMESTTVLKRSLLTEEPMELSKASLVGVPADDDPPELLKLVLHKDHKGRYSFFHTRDWRMTGQTEHHLVLRLLERGDFIAQATITAWRKEPAGQHMDADEFKKQVAASPNWEMEEIVEAGETPTDEGRYAYRITAKGAQDGIKVVQEFILLAGPQGDQVVVTFTMKSGNAAKIGTRDLALVNAIAFPKK